MVIAFTSENTIGNTLAVFAVKGGETARAKGRRGLPGISYNHPRTF
jgi:hypothetical protein